MITILHDIFIMLAYLVGILTASFFALFLAIVIINLWKGRL